MSDSDKDFLEKCRKIDFSAESKNFEANLAALLGGKKTEERVNMKRFSAKKIVIAAAIAVLALSGTVLAASPMWRPVETAIIQGEQYVEHFSVYESDEGYTMGLLTLTDTNSGTSEAVVAEIDGRREVIADRHAFDNLDEALSHLNIPQGIMLPAVLPYGFEFAEAAFPVSPVRHPDEYGVGRFLIVDYTGGEALLRLMASYYPAEWGLPVWAEAMTELEILGHPAKYGGGMLGFIINDVMYTLNGLDFDGLVAVAESLE